MARAEQFNSDAALAASGAERQIASLREQKGLLEEQVCICVDWFGVGQVGWVGRLASQGP